MNAAFEANVRIAIAVLTRLPTLPPGDRIIEFPEELRRLGIVVLKQALLMETERRTIVVKKKARKKAWADPAVRQRMSEARKKALADPAVRQRMSEARKKALADPAVRQRMSEASKKAWARDRRDRTGEVRRAGANQR